LTGTVVSRALVAKLFRLLMMLEALFTRSMMMLRFSSIIF